MTFALCEHALKRPRTNNLVRGVFAASEIFGNKKRTFFPQFPSAEEKSAYASCAAGKKTEKSRQRKREKRKRRKNAFFKSRSLPCPFNVLPVGVSKSFSRAIRVLPVGVSKPSSRAIRVLPVGVSKPSSRAIRVLPVGVSKLSSRAIGAFSSRERSFPSL